MKLKNKIAALSTLLMFQTVGTLNAAAIDNELAVIAAEQDKTDETTETFDPDSLDADKNKPKTKDEIKDEEKRLEDERKAAKKKIKDERKKSRDELNGKAPLSKNPASPVRKPENNSLPPPNIETSADDVKPTENTQPTNQPVNDNPPAATVQPVENIQPVAETDPASLIPSVKLPQSVKAPNPIRDYANFNEIVQALNFTPLYIPKKSGYEIASMSTIENHTAEIRYSRKWEPNVSLKIRTYRRAEGEELKDISGIHGVKWRVNVANGITIYIAKINENNNVAAWAVGNYTFSAYVENLSFAAFYSLVSDELVDLSQHYYLGN